MRLLNFFKSSGPPSTLSVVTLTLAYFKLAKHSPNHDMLEQLQTWIKGHGDCERLPPRVRQTLNRVKRISRDKAAQ